MTIEKLLLTLDSGINYYFYGSTDIEVYAAEKLEDTENMTPDVLYVTDAYASKDLPGNVLYASSSDIPIILKQLRCSISRDYQITSELNHLNQKVLNNVSLQHISDTCRSILNTTIFLLDEHFSLLAFSGKNESKRFLSSILANNIIGKDTSITYLPSNDICPYDAVLAPININGKLLGYILSSAWEGTGNIKDISDVLHEISKILSNCKGFSSSRMPISKRQQYLTELLQLHNIDAVTAKQKQKELNFPEHDKYFVLSIKINTDKKLIFMRDTLQTILKEEVYEYNHYFFAIVGCEIHKRISEQTYPKLLLFLKENDMYAGLSNGFLDFSLLRTAFEQSITAPSLRQYISGKEIRFCRYEDLILSHLLEMAFQKGIPYRSFCHPNVVNIERYDQEHGTEYLKTLSAYVYNNLRLSETASKLYIHRNTLYHRINILREQFGIDFDNPREFMKLQISCTAYGFTGEVKNANQIFGPMN